MIPATPIAAPNTATNSREPNASLVSRPTTIAPEQLRAARGLLGWSRSELAKEAKLSAETIKNIEHATYSPKDETINTLVEAFARRGILFVQHETVVSIPGACGQADDTMVLFYAGIVSVTASTSKVKGEAHG